MAVASVKEPFVVHCGTCQHEWALGFLPMPAEAFGKLTHARCPGCGSKKVLCGEAAKATNVGEAYAWLQNGDTGISSRTIWYTLMHRNFPPRDWPDIPADPDDFGRCYRLLKVMPEWRARLPEVALRFPSWKPLVDAWDELTLLYEKELPTGRATNLYQRMQELRGEAR